MTQKLHEIIHTNLGDRSYDIHVGTALLARAGQLVASGYFGPPVEPEPGASAGVRLLGLLGRSWT